MKRGNGGIRDIEFAVQLLQLVHGRHDRVVRARATLDALEAARRRRLRHDGRRASLDDAYVWLRTVEHRLQLVDEHQTHTLPDRADARTHLARVLGFRDRLNVIRARGVRRPSINASEALVRAIHEKLFFAPVFDTLAGVGRLPEAAARSALAAFGFHDMAQTRAALSELTARAHTPFARHAAASARDPRLALGDTRPRPRAAPAPAAHRGLHRDRSTLARRFRETPVTARAHVRASSDRRACSALALHRQPDFVDALADDDDLLAQPSHPRRAGRRGARHARLARRRARAPRRAPPVQAPPPPPHRRTRLLGFAALEAAERELSDLADACVEAALRSLEPDASVRRDRPGPPRRRASCRTRPTSMCCSSTTATAAADFDERPSASRRARRRDRRDHDRGQRVPRRHAPAARGQTGRAGAVARRLSRVLRAVGTDVGVPGADQGAFVAGDAELGAAFVDLANGFIYRDPFPESGGARSGA